MPSPQAPSFQHLTSSHGRPKRPASSFELPGATRERQRRDLRDGPRPGETRVLTLDARERSFLLSRLNAQLYAPRSSPDAVWHALKAVFDYPRDLPELPPSRKRPTWYLASDDGHVEPFRRRIVLSEAQLLRAFSILSLSRPRTRSGLLRLLVVLQLLAEKRGKRIGALADDFDAGRTEKALSVDPYGLGLRPKDASRLLEWLALSHRSPRREVEVKAAVHTFSRLLEEQRDNPELATDNAMLYRSMTKAAVEGKSSEVFEALHERRQTDERPESGSELLQRFVRAHRKGESTDSMWTLFVQTLQRANELDIDRRRMWNNMLWHLARTRQMALAATLYEAMQRGEQRLDLSKLEPPLHQTAACVDLGTPPSPDSVSHAIMIKGYSHEGDLASALRLLLDSLPSSDSLNTAAVQNFTSVFQGFAMHCVEPAERRALHKLPTGRTPEHLLGSVDLTVAAWDSETLAIVVEAFLQLQPPKTDPRANHEGKRTAPSARQLAWMIAALESATGFNSAVIADIWNRALRKFADERFWTGFRIDTLLARRLSETHALSATQIWQ